MQQSRCVYPVCEFHLNMLKHDREHILASFTKALTKTLQTGRRMGELFTMPSANMLILYSTVKPH